MNQVANTVILPVEEYEALRAQVLSMTQELDNSESFRISEQELHFEQLAASQAREAKLRAALEYVAPMYCDVDIVTEALALPTDTTALDERLAQERERCAKVCEQTSPRHTECQNKISAAIRGMK